MSKFNKKTLAAALVAALAVPSAYAFVINTGGDAAPEMIAEEIGNAITMTEDVEFTTQLGDTIIGRTTGVQLLVTLTGGEFASAPTLSVGPAVSGPGTWNGVLAAGGTAGTDVAQFTFSPTEPGTTIDEGIFAFIAGLDLQNAPGDVSMNVLVRDPVGGVTLEEYDRVIISRDSGLTTTCTANPSPSKIDVGTSSDFQPRTGLVGAPYVIGGADHTTAVLGTIEMTTSGGFEFDGDTLFGSTVESSAGFEGIESLYLSDSATCDVSADSIEYTFDPVTGTYSFSEDGLFSSATTSVTQTLCATVSGSDEIDAQSFTVTGTVNGSDVDPGGSCNVAPLEYNGSLVKVYHVNPAGNSQAQSFVRVINQSNNAGMVTVHGYDDAGNRYGPIWFELGPRQSQQFNSVDLEDGNPGKGIEGGFGDGVGKWRLEVLGEFDNMMVQGLNRNRDTGTVTNLTDADAQFEQDLLHRTTLGL